MNMVIYREATEDVYAGIEWPMGSEPAKRMIEFLRNEMKVKVRDDAGIGVKPISEFGTKRLVRKAIRYAIENRRRNVTLVHKGNIMKYTEGAFRDWGYEVARDEFANETVSEKDVDQNYAGVAPRDLVVIKDRIADNMLQQLLTRTDEYEVLALPNLNGDYISDAAAGQVGGLGVAPGGNIGDFVALFEPIHGTAPKYAGQDKVNPTAEILAGQMLLDYLGWKEAANLVLEAVKATIAAKIVTYDLARQTEGAREVKCSQFARAVIERL
jgi:isocitrate dehydrogenase